MHTCPFIRLCIGRGGSRIKEMESTSGAKIKVTVLYQCVITAHQIVMFAYKSVNALMCSDEILQLLTFRSLAALMMRQVLRSAEVPLLKSRQEDSLKKL